MPKKKKTYNKIPSYKKYDSEDDIPKYIDPEDDPRNLFTKQWRLITREEWGAVPGHSYRPLHTPVRKLRIIYDLNMDRCTVTKTCKKLVFGIQRRHIHLGWPDINLNFVVAGDGHVYEGLGWTKKIIRLPHHSVETGNMLAIGCIGRYNKMPFGEVTRHEWGALESKARTELWNPIMKILVMYGTNTKNCNNKAECIKRVQEMQISDIYQRKMPDINYNFLIGGDGNVYEGRGFAKKATPMSDYIPNSLIIGFIGDWTVEDPPQMFEDILTEFCSLYIKEGKINATYKRYFSRGY